MNTTRSSHTLLPLAAAAIATLVVGCGDDQPSLGELVATYAELHNADEVERTLDMFAPDAQFELAGQATLSDLDAIRAIHDYDVAIQTRLDFHDCVTTDNTVRCAVTERNKWAVTAGIDELRYTSSVFHFDVDDRIERIVATMSDESAAALGAVLAEFVPWLLTEQPARSAPLFDAEGNFIYSHDNGVLVVDLLADWRTASNSE